MSMRAVGSLGAAYGAKFALAYGVIFIVVGAARYGADLRAAPPEGNFWLAYSGGVVSLAIASLGLTLLMAIIAAALGAVTALCAAGLYRLAAKGGVNLQPVAVGLSVAIAAVLLLHLALWQAGLWSWSSLLASAYLFWLGLPAILYILAAVLAGRVYGAKAKQQMSARLPTAIPADGTIFAPPSSSGKEQISASR